MSEQNQYDLCIIGGAGHIGLPLGVTFAKQGLRTVLLDVDAAGLQKILQGTFPFMEKNGDASLKEALQKGTLFGSTDPAVISKSSAIICVVGTPVDEYLNPDYHVIFKLLDGYAPHFRSGQTFILRSTVYPGTTIRVHEYFQKKGLDIHVSFCPERIVQGKALEELTTMPQIISAFSEEGYVRVENLFRRITPRKLVRVEPTEAELAKLFSNAWRYIQFSVGNQFYMIAEQHGLNYHRIYRAMLDDYERNAGLMAPGFSAGPCLLKDTLQLASFNNNMFFLGHSAMLVNEGMPKFIIDQLKRAGSLTDKTIGILGMAFKQENDDHRDSLSYKLKKLSKLEAARVLCHDPYVTDSDLVGLDQLLKESDIIILGAQHKMYGEIDPAHYPEKHFVDIWGFWNKER